MNEPDDSIAADAVAARYAIVAGRFNRFITERLVAGATATLARHGVAAQRIDCVWVPGAFEIPMACKRMAKSGDYAAVIALGAVIRGATAHFDYVAGECARGIARLNLEGDVPIIFGVLTTDTVAQAQARASDADDAPAREGKQRVGNKGADAALAALQMASTLRRL
ncbi:MAG: 6,7-dimethyl-8-ribityllumazine synthase [bacterium]